MKKVPIRCESLDKLLSGGVECGTLTEIYGEAGSGKTNVCLQLARNVCLEGKRVVFIDSEGVSLERLKQISGDDFEDVAKNILFFNPHTFESQEKAVEDAARLTRGDVDVGAVIVDSLTIHYRAAFGTDEEGYSRRSLSKQVGLLLSMARKQGFPVVVTSQVYSDSDKNTLEPIGGHALSYGAKAIIFLGKVDVGVREAVVKKHRSIAEGERAYFMLTGSGIDDLPKHDDVNI